MDNTVILLILTALFVLYLMTRNNNLEGYQTTRLPFDTQGLVYPMKLDLFYERQRDHALDSVASLAGLKGLGGHNKPDYIAPPSKVCSDNLPKKPSNDGTYKDCCQKCMTSLKHQEANTKLYYAKFRDLQNRVAKLQNENVFLTDVLNKYKKKLAFCKRELTLEPVVAKCHRNYDMVGNSISGLGVETQFTKESY